MTLVLLSHVAADDEVVGKLASALDEAGQHVAAGRPGDPDAASALARCDAVVLLVSPTALASEELTNEVLAAGERGVPIIPVLAGVSHLDLATQQPAWRTAIGSATAIEVPPEGLDAIVPRVVEGVRSVTETAPRGAAGAGARGGRRTAALAAGAVAVALVLAAAIWWAVGRDSGDEGGAPAAGPATSATTSTSPTPSPTATASTPPADSATTAVTSVAGKLRIVGVRLVEKFCSGPEGESCTHAKAGQRLAVLEVEGWDGQSLPYTEELAHQMDQAYVQSGTTTAGFISGKQSMDHNTWEIAYTSVPPDAASTDLLLRWPGNPTLLLHPAGG